LTKAQLEELQGVTPATYTGLMDEIRKLFANTKRVNPVYY